MNKEYDCLRLDNQLCFPLYAVARKITAKYTPYFKELDITYTQYIVLMVLWENEDKETSVGELCRRLYLDSGTLTPLLKKMEDKNLLIRKRSKEDERSVLITLTDKGKGLKEKCKEIPAKIGQCVNLNQEDAESLYRILYLLLEEL